MKEIPRHLVALESEATPKDAKSRPAFGRIEWKFIKMNDKSFSMKPLLKDKTAAVRRQHILDAAARAFAETGYQRATIRDVAKAAGVADGTIYNSFANKADLLLSLLDPLARHLPTALPQTAAVLSADIETLLRDRWSALTPEVFDLLRVVLSEGLVDRAVGDALLARVLGPAITPLERALAAAGLPDAPLAARSGVAMFLGLSILHMLGDPVIADDHDAMPERMAALLILMLRLPNGS